MNNLPQYSPEELKVIGEVPPPIEGMPGTPIYNFPVSGKEAMKMMYQRKAPWEIASMFDVETVQFNPRVIPDNVARALVFDGEFVPGVTNTVGGKDMFGIDWEYIPSAGGSMVRPGVPFIEDAEELETKIVWPDIDSWDWEGSRELNREYLSQPKCMCSWLLSGWFERLISFMEFENAAIALIDEEQQDYVKAFFDKLTDLYIHLVDKMLEYFPEIDVFYIHDDWGSQKSSFFSPDVAAEMIVPYMRRLTDHIHEKGRFAHLHSCGHLMNQIENIIAAGWDAWDPQTMNDSYKLYENYGDKILIGITPQKPFDPMNSTEEEQRAAARDFAERFCNPQKPSMINIYAIMEGYMTPAFREEIYIQSRKKYAE